MKKLLVIAGIIALFLAVVQSGVSSAAIVFLLTGAIPSTGYSIPPIMMFVLMTVSLWLVFAALSQDWIRKSVDDAHLKPLHRTVALPKRRYRKFN